MEYIKIGDKFGRLTVIEELKQRSKDGHKIYKCKCICGNITNVRSRELLNGDTKSCGCLQKEKLTKRYWNRTQPDRIFSNNINKNNKSGIKGVCFDKTRNKWVASFQYQGKHYNLGRYNNIADAEKARKNFEDKIRYELGENKIMEDKVIVFCDTENQEVDFEYANKLIEYFRKITGWKVLEGTRIYNDLIEFSKGYSKEKRPVEEVAYIFKIAHRI